MHFQKQGKQCFAIVKISEKGVYFKNCTKYDEEILNIYYLMFIS
jgi:hypothetical protein